MVEIKDILTAVHLKKQVPTGHICSALTPSVTAEGKLVAKELMNSSLQNAAPADFGYKEDITTLTEIRADVIQQKFYEVNPSDYIPVEVGKGAMMDELLTYTSFSTGDDFESGIIDTARSSKLAEVDVALDAVKQKIVQWGKQGGYSIFELEQAKRSGNWNKIEAVEVSRKKNWDLGVQKIAFLGSDSDAQVPGLLTQSGVTSDLVTITKSLSSMTDNEFATFLSDVIQKYYANTNSTALPDTFIIPTSDFLGLSRPYSESFQTTPSRLEVLRRTFTEATMNPNFRVLPLAYADATNNLIGGSGRNRYVLLNSKKDTLCMNIPLNYTSTVYGTYNNFNFQSVAYGQYTGVQVYRPLEVYYMDY